MNIKWSGVTLGHSLYLTGNIFPKAPSEAEPSITSFKSIYQLSMSGSLGRLHRAGKAQQNLSDLAVLTDPNISARHSKLVSA